MIWRFGDAKELGHRTLLGFKLEPTVDLRVPGEPEGGEQRFVEWLHLGQTGYAEVDVIKATGHETKGKGKIER